VNENLSLSVKWFRKAPEQGYADAQFYMGIVYEQGQGVIQPQWNGIGIAKQRSKAMLKRKHILDLCIEVDRASIEIIL